MLTEALGNVLTTLSQSKNDVYILGDINIDFLKFNSNIPTEEYLYMLYTQNFLPIITKPTRLTNHTATLIDHIYTIVTSHQITSGIAGLDIPNHLPIFCIVDILTNRAKKQRYYRDYSKIDRESYLNEIKAINWDEVFNYSGDLHDLTTKTIDKIQTFADKHVPYNLASHSKLRRLNKPWITNAILKSIKVRHKMYYTHFLSKGYLKINEYK